MKIIESPLFTWYLPDIDKFPIDPVIWDWYGGKWVVHDSLQECRRVAREIDPLLNTRTIESAKIWRGDPTVIIINSFDKYKLEVNGVLDKVGASRERFWVYDSVTPNLADPINLTKAIYYAIRTISKGAGKYSDLP